MISEKDLGSSLLFFALFVVMLWVATGRARLPARSAAACSPAAPRSPVPGLRPRPGPRRDLAQPVGRRRRRRLPDRPGWFALADGGIAGTGLGLGDPEPHPRGRDRLHLRRHRRGARPARHHRRPRRLPADGRRRPAHRRPRRRAVREAARHRPHHAARPAGVHHHRRRHPAAARSPASRCRSCPTAARRWSPTTCCWRCWCASPTTTPAGAARSGRRAAAAPAAPARGGRVNSQIRQARHRPCSLLLPAPCSCSSTDARRSSAGPTQPRRTHAARNTRDDRPRLQPRPRRDPHRRRRGARPVRSDAEATASSASASYPTGELFGHVTGYFTFNFGADGVERAYNDELAGPSREHRADRSSATSSSTATDVGDVTLTARAPTCSRSPATRSATAQGSVVALDPRDRRGPGPVELPLLRPQPAGRPTTSGRRRPRRDALEPDARPRRCSPAPTGERSSRARRSRSSPPPPASSRARSPPTTPVYPPADRASTSTSPTTTVSNFGGATCGGTLFEILARVVQHRLRRDGRRHLGAERHGRRRRGLRLQRAPADRPPGAGRVDVPHRPSPPTRATARWPRPSIGQNDVPATPARRWRWWPPRIANDGVDHDAPRDRPRSPTTTASTVRTDEPAGVAASPSRRRPPTPCAEAMVGVVERRHGTAACRSPAFEVGGKTGTAQLGTDPPSSPRLDHRLRRPPRRARRVAVAVIVEGQPGASEQTGGRVAAPIARAVMEAVLASRPAERQPDRRPQPLRVTADTPTPEPTVFNGRYELAPPHRAGAAWPRSSSPRDQLLDRPVAVKVLFPEFATDPSFVERFRREAQAAANLNHPNIVGVYDWGQEDGTYFIVMEYVDGRSLAEILRSRGPAAARPRPPTSPPTSPPRSAFAHRNGVVHRDIKPGNILITPAGPGEGDRLRHRPGHATRRRGQPHPDRRGDGHRHLLLARAGPGPRRSTRAATSTRSASCSTRCSPASRRSAATARSPSPTSTCRSRRRPPRSINPDVPAALEAIIAEAAGQEPGRPLRLAPRTCAPTSAASARAPGPRRARRAVAAARPAATRRRPPPRRDRRPAPAPRSTAAYVPSQPTPATSPPPQPRRGRSSSSWSSLLAVLVGAALPARPDARRGRGRRRPRRRRRSPCPDVVDLRMRPTPAAQLEAPGFEVDEEPEDGRRRRRRSAPWSQPGPRGRDARRRGQHRHASPSAAAGHPCPCPTSPGPRPTPPATRSPGLGFTGEVDRAGPEASDDGRARARSSAPTRPRASQVRRRRPPSRCCVSERRRHRRRARRAPNLTESDGVNAGSPAPGFNPRSTSEPIADRDRGPGHPHRPGRRHRGRERLDGAHHRVAGPGRHVPPVTGHRGRRPSAHDDGPRGRRATSRQADADDGGSSPEPRRRHPGRPRRHHHHRVGQADVGD